MNIKKANIAFSLKQRSTRTTWSLCFGSCFGFQELASHPRALFLLAIFSLTFHFPVACGSLRLYLCYLNTYFEIQASWQFTVVQLFKIIVTKVKEVNNDKASNKVGLLLRRSWRRVQYDVLLAAKNVIMATSKRSCRNDKANYTKRRLFSNS